MAYEVLKSIEYLCGPEWHQKADDDFNDSQLFW